MFTSVDKRSFFVFIGVLLTVTIIFILLITIFISNGLIRELLISAALSTINSLAASYFAVSGEEGTFKRLMSSTIFRLLSLIMILILLVLYTGMRAVPLMVSFILFFVLHQLSLIFWLKLEIRRIGKVFFPKKQGRKR